MTVFWATSRKGAFSLRTDSEAAKFRKFLVENDGVRIKIEPFVSESPKMRRFFEGAIISLLTYYQDGMDHEDPLHLRQMREWVMQEFNGEYRMIAGKTARVTKSSKGVLHGITERVIDWMADQGYDVSLLSPEDYKRWRDEIAMHGGPQNYISYLRSVGKLL